MKQQVIIGFLKKYDIKFVSPVLATNVRYATVAQPVTAAKVCLVSAAAVSHDLGTR